MIIIRKRKPNKNLGDIVEVHVIDENGVPCPDIEVTFTDPESSVTYHTNGAGECYTSKPRCDIMIDGETLIEGVESPLRITLQHHRFGVSRDQININTAPRNKIMQTLDDIRGYIDSGNKKAALSFALRLKKQLEVSINEGD